MERFTLNQIPEFKSYIERYTREGVQRGVLSAAMKLVHAIKVEIIPSRTPQPVDRGVFRNGWEFQKTENGADIYNTVPYAPIIEYGAKAENVKVGAAMINALTEWVKRKGLVGGMDRRASGATRRKSASVVADEARSFAWAIAMNMKKAGIFNGGKGLRILEEVRARAPQILREEIVAELGR